MHKKLKKTIVSLHIAAAVFLIMGITALFLFVFIKGNMGSIALLCLSIAVIIEIVVSKLKKYKRGAWIAAIVLCVLLLPSVLIPLGIIGLFGLLNKEVRNEFARDNVTISKN